MFTGVQKTNRWESPWWWCIWSFRIHSPPLCRTWLIKRERARLTVSSLSHPRLAAAVPGDHARFMPHLRWLLIETMWAEVYHGFLFLRGTEGGFSQHSADSMTTTTTEHQVLQLAPGSSAELSHFNICIIDCILIGIPLQACWKGNIVSPTPEVNRISVYELRSDRHVLKSWFKIWKTKNMFKDSLFLMQFALILYLILGKLLHGSLSDKNN